MKFEMEPGTVMWINGDPCKIVEIRERNGNLHSIVVEEYEEKLMQCPSCGFYAITEPATKNGEEARQLNCSNFQCSPND